MTAAMAEATNDFIEQCCLENIGPNDDFKWGMISGNISALRWTFGADWNFLDV